MLVHSRLFASVAFLAASLAVAPPAQAQCGPDNLTGPCCSAAIANIPPIPALQMDSRWICFNGCNVAQNFLDCVNLGAHVPATSGGVVQCGVYDFRFRIKTCGAGGFLWNGTMKAFYSRTWNEFPVVGAPPIQVWRFIINGDMIPTALLPVGPCRKPECLLTYTRCYFSGYIDYAFDCTIGGWKAAFAVSHECDAIHHTPGSARPAPAGGAHASRSFSIVGPGSTFVASVAGPRSDGPITAEAVRWNNWAPAAGPVCMCEEPATGSWVAGNELCFCTPGGPTQYIQTDVNAQGVCGSLVAGLPGTPLLQKRIGGWTAATVFPGTEFVLFDFGFLTYRNGCTMMTTTEWFEGGETIGGYPARALTGIPLDPEFEDLGSCNNSKTNPAIRIGGPHIVNYVLNFNLP